MIRSLGDAWQVLHKEGMQDEELEAIARGLGLKDNNELSKLDFISRARIWIASSQDENAGAISTMQDDIHRLRSQSKTLDLPIASGALDAAAGGAKAAEQPDATNGVGGDAVADAPPREQSTWSPPPHLFAVEAESVGVLSLVVGNELDMQANNLLATRSGSSVTVCPRSVLLTPGSGSWYFEIEILRASASGGVCIGLVSERFNAAGEKNGVGDDAFGWGISSSGTKHRGEIHSIGNSTPWKDGDVIGCQLDCSGRSEIRFTRNGQLMQAGGASFSGVRGDIGLCPALTIDCGFLGYFNLGKYGFRYAPASSVASVHAYIQEKQAAVFRESATSAGEVKPINNGRAVRVKRVPVPSSASAHAPEVGFNWKVDRGLEFACATLAPSGVLLTAGKWYFEVHFDKNVLRFGEICIGVCDTAFGTREAIGRYDTLGVDKHSWGLSVGPWCVPGLLKHSNCEQRFGAEPAFGRCAGNLSGLVIGCAIDADVGTIHYTMGWSSDVDTNHYTMNGEDRELPYCALAFEGVQAVGGMRPAISVLYSSFTIHLDDCVLLDALRKAGPLHGYRPLKEKVVQFQREMAVGRPSAGLSSSSSSRQTAAHQWLVPSSGHDHLFFSSDGWINCNGPEFLCSLTAPELLCRQGAFYYEVHIGNTLGGPGTSDHFEDSGKRYDPNDGEEDDGELKEEVQGGSGAFGWATPARFRGIYHEARGVGHLPNSWGYAGTMLPDVKHTARYVAFRSSTQTREEPPELWNPTDPLSLTADEPLWQPGGVVGCGIVVEPDGSGEVTYHYDGKLRYKRQIRAPLLRGGVVPAISLHSNLRVRVNMGDEQKFVHGRDEIDPTALIEQKNPPMGFQPALRGQVDSSENSSHASNRRRAAGKKPDKKERDEHQKRARELSATVEKLVQTHDRFLGDKTVEKLGARFKHLAEVATHLSLVTASADSGSLPPPVFAASPARVRNGEVTTVWPSPAPTTASPMPTSKRDIELQIGSPKPVAARPVFSDEEEPLTLNLSNISLKDEAFIDVIFDVLEAFPDGVHVLRCSVCGLAPDNMRALAMRIDCQQKLRTLDLSHNALHAPGLTTLALALRSMNEAALRELDVSANEIHDDGVAALCCNLPSPLELESGKGIRVLKLMQNSIGSEGAFSISLALMRLPISELHLDQNRLGVTGAQHLAAALCRGTSATTLQHLSLSDNALEDAGVSALAEGLQRNSTLVMLRLGHGNYLKGDGLRALSQSLSANRCSRLVKLIVKEPQAKVADSVELIFSLRDAVRACDLTNGHSPELYVGGLLFGSRLGGASHAVKSEAKGEPALSGADAIRFFAGPLTYCMQSLRPAGERLVELGEFLIDDRVTRGELSYVEAADAQASIVEAVLLGDASERKHNLELMLGPRSKYGVRRFKLSEQRTRVVSLIPHSAVGESTDRTDGTSFVAHVCKRGELWLHATESKRAPSSAASTWTGGSPSPPSPPRALSQAVAHASNDATPLGTPAPSTSQRKLSRGGHSRVAPSAAAPLPTVQLHAQTLADASTSAPYDRHVGSEPYGVWRPDDVPEVIRDVELKQDLWLTAHAIGEDEEAYRLLKPGAQHASNGGARTPLLIALHAGHQDAALLLVHRLRTTRCNIVNSATKQPESCPALMLMVKPSTKEKFAQRRAHPPSDHGQLVLLQCPDAVAVGLRDEPFGVEALRVAAVRGMAPVVTALLEYRQMQGPALHRRGEDCHRISGVLGMHMPPNEGRTRTLLHDVCRNLLPRGDGIEHEELNKQLVSFASEILALRPPCSGGVEGKMLVKHPDENRRLPLHYAAAFGHFELLELMLDTVWDLNEQQEANWQDLINAVDDHGWTPLALATSNGHLNAARYLVEYGADPMVPMLQSGGMSKKRRGATEGSQSASQRVVLDETEWPELTTTAWPELTTGESVPCALVISLLRMHFEEEVRPDIVATMSGRQQEDNKMRQQEEEERTSSPSPARRLSVGAATSKTMVSEVLHTPVKRLLPSRSFALAPKDLDGPQGAVEEPKEQLEHQLVGDWRVGQKANARALASKIHDVLVEARGEGVQDAGASSAYPVRRYRRYWLTKHVIFNATKTLWYLVLLTAVVLCTSGSGFWFGRTTRSGVSYPFVLQAEVGGLVSKEVFDHEEVCDLPTSPIISRHAPLACSRLLPPPPASSRLLQPSLTFGVLIDEQAMDFNGVDQLSGLQSFLDPAEGPFFDILMSNDDGSIDTQNQLLGAVRLRLQRTQPNPSNMSTCPTSWLGGVSNGCPASGSRSMGGTSSGPLDGGAFVGSTSGQPYLFCADGVFCHSANQTGPSFAAVVPPFCFWPDDRWAYGYGGHVIDLPPRNPPAARAAVQALLDDNLLDDGITRALFIDYTVWNHPLSFAVVVHLSVEMLASGRMVARTDAVAVPLDWPFEGSGYVMVVAEV